MSEPTLFPRDEQTIDYFDRYTPVYMEKFYDDVVELINKFGSGRDSVIDIGCGTGNILNYLKNVTQLKTFCGMDVSGNCLDVMRKKYGFTAMQASILDDLYINGVTYKYDFVLMGAILHHLIGSNRKVSHSLASQAVRNGLKLLKDDGYLIVVERMFYPALIHDIAFCVKRFVTRFIPGRFHILGHHISNIGAPVVSYYSPDQLKQILEDENRCSIVEVKVLDMRIKTWMKLLGLRKTEARTFVARKREV